MLHLVYVVVLPVLYLVDVADAVGDVDEGSHQHVDLGAQQQEQQGLLDAGHPVHA